VPLVLPFVSGSSDLPETFVLLAVPQWQYRFESGNDGDRPRAPKPCDCPDDCPLKHPPEYTAIRDKVQQTSAVVADGFDLPMPAVAIASHDVERSILLRSTRVMAPFVTTSTLLYAYHKLRC